VSADCDAARGWISEALDGELAADEATALAHHLGGCHACSAMFRAEVASHRRLMESAAAREAAHSPPTKATRRIAMPRRRRPTRRRAGVMAWIAIAALVVVGVGLLLSSRGVPERAGKVIAVVASADGGSVIPAAGPELPLRAQMPLVDGDRIQARGSLTFALADEGTTITSAGCDLTLSQSGRRKRWELLSGAITAEVEHQPANGGLTITTPQATAEVVGTRFSLSAEPARTRLEVSDGRVRFARHGAAEAILVEAGRSAVIDDRPAPPALPPTPTVKTRVIDDFEGPLRWKLAESVAPMRVALVAVDGGHALHLDYQPKPSDPDTYAQVAHAFNLAPGDRAIRLRIRVASASAGANWNLQVRQRDRSCWWMGGGRFTELHPGWTDVELPIPANPRRCTDDHTPFDPAAVAELMLSVCNESAAFDLDDVSVIAPP
jgi:ferric-dicitrate binding protein FerR (iron transport regulator)